MFAFVNLSAVFIPRLKPWAFYRFFCNGSDPSDNSAPSSGAAYIFVRQTGVWSQQAYLKAANVEGGDQFGCAVAISTNTIIVGASWEDSNGSSPADNSAFNAGAAYVFVYNSQTQVWSQQAYLKASNAGATDNFGSSVAILGDIGIVGAIGEASNGSSPDDNSALYAGAAYIFARDSQTQAWSQQAYLKASNAEQDDYFGKSVAISGNTFVVGAPYEASNGSLPSDNSAPFAGAAYIFIYGPEPTVTPTPEIPTPTVTTPTNTSTPTVTTPTSTPTPIVTITPANTPTPTVANPTQTPVPTFDNFIYLPIVLK